MDVEPQSIPPHMCSSGAPHGGLLCLKDNETAGPLHEPRPRPGLRLIKRNVPGLEGRIPISLPSFLHDRSSAEKAENPADTQGDHDSTGVARSSLVPSTAGTMHRNSKETSNLPGDVAKSFRRTASLGDKSKSDPGGIPGYSDRLKGMGFSDKVIHLVVNARRGSTASAYSSPWNRWSAWCDQRHLDPYSAPVEQCGEYLADLYSQGLAPRTIGVHRSAISAYYIRVDGAKAGEHPLISSILRGASILRPPQPRYCVIWDVDDVLNFLRSIDNGNASLPVLSRKTAVLTALSTASRGGEIKLLRKDMHP